MKLTHEDIDRRLNALPGWSREGGAIRRQYVFGGFPEAVAYVVQLGFAAQAADHHPDLLISYKKVTVTWSTHSEGGVTEKDFAGARESDTIAGRSGA